MVFSTAYEWFTYIASFPIADIALGLERVHLVGERLSLLVGNPLVITVAGTNGKGSTVAGLEAIYLAQHYRVGAFTSPMLLTPNEQVRINGAQASDDELCQAFSAVDAARSEVLLTTFEFFTLVALVIFKKHLLDVIILEVGLGGRLDAVNIIDADIAIVTSISLDHTAWLGNTREDIAFEKAGIFRPGKSAIFGESKPPHRLVDHAKKFGAPLYCLGSAYDYVVTEKTWSWSTQATHYHHLPLNSLLTQNMACVLMAVHLLQQQLRVSEMAIKQGLASVALTGRIQVIPGAINEIHDVAHNPAAVALLAKRLKEMKTSGKMHAVFSMLADKDIIASITVMKEMIHHWCVAPLNVKRGLSQEKLQQAFQDTAIHAVTFFSAINEAYAFTKQNAAQGDCIVVFGSFHTVAAVLM